MSLFDELVDLLPGRWDPWSKIPAPVPYVMFGRGSRRPFRWYLEGRSSVAVSSVEDVERWLRTCTVVDDEQLSGEPDHWMHPGAFEVVRMGDCDDHALWAWRKLLELGRRASLVVGRWRVEPEDGHVWVMLETAGGPELFEATEKAGPARRPLSEVRDEYRPFFAVDGDLRTWAYAGAAHELDPFDSGVGSG